jgi:FMN reductase
LDRPYSLLTLVGNPKPGSKTLQAGLQVASQIAELLEGTGVNVSRGAIDLAEYASGLFDWDDAPVNGLVHQVCTADLLLAVSPTYKATYTGLLKAFLDRIPPTGLGGHRAIPIMVGAAPIHTLAVETHLRPLLIELGASCPTRGLFIQESELPGLTQLVARWLDAAAPALTLIPDAQITSTP